MNPIPNRIVIYPKDVMNITGRRDRTARKLLTRIRKKFKKKRGEFITLEEFCGYTGLKQEHVTNFLI
jgi:hypothetical protein